MLCSIVPYIRAGQISSKFIGGTAMKNPMHAFCYAGRWETAHSQRIDSKQLGTVTKTENSQAFSLVSSFPKFSIVFFWRFGDIDIAWTCLDQNFTSTTVSGFLKAKVRGQISSNLPERWVSSCFIHGLDRFGPSSMARIRGLLADPDADEPGDGWMVSTSLSESFRKPGLKCFFFLKHENDVFCKVVMGVLQQDSKAHVKVLEVALYLISIV